MVREWSEKTQNDCVSYERVVGGVEKREVALRGGSLGWKRNNKFFRNSCSVMCKVTNLLVLPTNLQ